MYLPAKLGMLSPILAGMMHLRGKMWTDKKGITIVEKNKYAGIVNRMVFVVHGLSLYYCIAMINFTHILIKEFL